MVSTRRQVRKAVATVVGGLLVGVGAVLLVAPGPGLIVLSLGFTVLASEYDWARRRLDAVRAGAARAQAQSVSSRPKVVATLLVGAVMTGAGAVLALSGGAADDVATWVSGLVPVLDVAASTVRLSAAVVAVSGVLVVVTTVVAWRREHLARDRGF